MPENELFEPLEDRLAAEAQQLSAGWSSRPCVAGLLAEFVRRRRRRAVARALFATAAVLVLGFMVAHRNHRAELGRPQAADESRGIRVASAVAALPTHEPATGNSSEDVPAGTANAPPGSFVAIAILIPQTGDDGQQRLVPAWYVPGQLEEIDPNDLSPAERSAVSQLLGPDYETSQDQTI